MIRIAIAAVALMLPAAAFAERGVSRDPDWPCQQIKVSDLSPASVWSGPAVDAGNTNWQADPAVSELVARVAPRREPIEQARTLIHDFARTAGERKQPLLLLVFAGVFDVLDQERGSVIAGLDRFGVRQKALAAEIRGDNAKLRALQADPAADPKAVEQLTQRLMWQAEVFQDRRQALGYVCDVPGKIEQRLFALAHQIQQELE